LVNRPRGFTLIELLVVLVLAGMMYALVPPMFGAGMAGAELKQAARQLAAGLRQTRGDAIKQHKDLALTLDIDGRIFKIGDVARVYQLPRMVDLKVFTAQSEVSERAAAIRFYPDGSSTGGRVTLVHGDKQFLVDVDWLTGRVTITE
jgi:general secretion pathway protein H